MILNELGLVFLSGDHIFAHSFDEVVSLGILIKLKGGCSFSTMRSNCLQQKEMQKNIARVKAVVQENLKCQHRQRKYVERQPARMKTDDQAVQDLQAAVHDFDADPCDISPNSEVTKVRTGYRQDLCMTLRLQ